MILVLVLVKGGNLLIKRITLNNINSDTESTRLRKLTDLVDFTKPFSRLRIVGNNIEIGKSNFTFSPPSTKGGDYATTSDISYDFNVEPLLSLDIISDLYVMNTTHGGGSGSDPANTTLVVVAY